MFSQYGVSFKIKVTSFLIQINIMVIVLELKESKRVNVEYINSYG